MTFRKELIELINRHSKENGSDTPDFILADYLIECLKNFNKTMKLRESWYGRDIAEPKGQLLNIDTYYERLAADINHNNKCARATLGDLPEVTAEDLKPTPDLCCGIYEDDDMQAELRKDVYPSNLKCPRCDTVDVELYLELTENGCDKKVKCLNKNCGFTWVVQSYGKNNII